METKLKKIAVPFTQVPNGLLYDPNISFKAKGIWAYMSAKPEGWNFSADRIADETKEERKAILAGLKELSEAGYITAKKKGDGRIEYTLHWEVAKTSMSEPKLENLKPLSSAEPNEPIVDISSMKMRPKRADYSSDEEYEKAFYKWNSK
jgi:hypothetical protein